MKKYNISKPEKYTKDGIEKTYWANIGTMTEWEKEDGSFSRIVEIPAIGLKAHVFLQQPKPVTGDIFGANQATPPSPAYTPDKEAIKTSVEAMNTPMESIPIVEDDMPAKDIPF